MDIVLKDLVGEECYVFIDDVIIFSKTAAENAARLENVLASFEKANLQLHPGKCVIFETPSELFRLRPVRERGFRVFGQSGRGKKIT